MAGYLVLARKYRSLTFDEVVGQEPISKTLVNAISSGRVAHAYLFTGTRGVGKTTMARILAKALNCQNSDQATPNPCNKCDACESIGRGDDVDVIEIDGASNRGIDEIRELRASAIFRPARCRYKVYYIDEVHMLTKEAFNALLKTLEEPPEHVKFIFATTEAEKVPATILSRCQRFDFRNIPTRQISDHLVSICKAEKVKADAGAIFRIARAAAGSMRDGLSLLDQLLAASGGKIVEADVINILGEPPDERTIQIAHAIADGKAADAIIELDAVLASGVTLTSAVKSLGDIFRNIMLAKVSGADSDLIELPESQLKAVTELAGKFSIPTIVHAVGVISAAGRNVRGSSAARALVEAVLVRLAEAEKFIDPASLIERLENLGASGVSTQKKKPVGRVATSAATSPSNPAPTPAATSDIQWEMSWLKANWLKVVANLESMGQLPVAGALRPAVVQSFDGKVLRLGFSNHHGTLVDRCIKQDAKIAATLTQLAGRAIKCEYIQTNSEPSPQTPVMPVNTALSTAEKEEIHKDPAVQQALSLFGGEVIDIRKDTNIVESQDAAEDGVEEDAK